MPSAFEGVQWPKGPEVSTEIKDLLAEFYRLADLKDPNSGKPMSEDVFAHDAVISMPNTTFAGKEGTYIADCFERFLCRVRSLHDTFSVNITMLTWSRNRWLPKARLGHSNVPTAHD